MCAANSRCTILLKTFRRNQRRAGKGVLRTLRLRAVIQQARQVEKMSKSKWFPYRATAPSPPKARVICFHHAGGTAMMWNKFIENKDFEVCGVQLPGREAREPEKKLNNVPDVVATVYPELKALISGDVPYVMVAHSMGAWCLWGMLERIKLERAKDASIRLPLAVFISSFPPPFITTPVWKQNNASMPEEEFKAELRLWGVNEAVFRPTIWPSFHDMLRQDFAIFDSYKHTQHSTFDGDSTVHAFLFWATADTRITEADLAAWSEIFPSNTQLKLEGHKHLFVMDKALTLKWGEGIAKILQEKLA